MEASQSEKNWEAYWSDLSADAATAFWDVPAELAAAVDLPYFQTVFDSVLPLVDFGCGNGTQTFFLAEHFPRVIGVDVARAAIEQARSHAKDDNPSFVVFDATRQEDARALHAQVGDANVYSRGTLHQFQPEDRPAVMASLGLILGDKGHLYLHELSPKAKTLFDDLVQKLGAPPPPLARVFHHGITPAEFAPADVRTYFPADHYEFAAEGEAMLNMSHVLSDGTRMQLPSFYMLIRRQ